MARVRTIHGRKKLEKRSIPNANAYGLKVMADAHGAEGIKRALRAGPRPLVRNSLRQGTLMDDECIGLF